MSYTVLSQGDIAVVFKSHACPCLNVTLPNLNIHLELSSFYAFAEVIASHASDLEQGKGVSNFVQVNTPLQGFLLHFRSEELFELHDILSAAIIDLELQEITSNHYS